VTPVSGHPGMLHTSGHARLAGSSGDAVWNKYFRFGHPHPRVPARRPAPFAVPVPLTRGMPSAIRYLVPGAVAGIVSFAFSRVMIEPLIGAAVDYEGAREHAGWQLAGGDHEHGHELFTDIGSFPSRKDLMSSRRVLASLRARSSSCLFCERRIVDTASAGRLDSSRVVTQQFRKDVVGVLVASWCAPVLHNAVTTRTGCGPGGRFGILDARSPQPRPWPRCARRQAPARPSSPTHRA
jgi:hypothetical protein